jgi:hypothetical protein
VGKLGAVAREMVREFGCAVLAMRIPVNDEFAIRLGEKLYGSMLEDELPLTRALQLALPDVAKTPLEVATPALFGQQATELALRVPKESPGSRAGLAAPDSPTSSRSPSVLWAGSRCAVVASGREPDSPYLTNLPRDPGLGDE